MFSIKRIILKLKVQVKLEFFKNFPSVKIRVHPKHHLPRISKTSVSMLIWPICRRTQLNRPNHPSNKLPSGNDFLPVKSVTLLHFKISTIWNGFSKKKYSFQIQSKIEFVSTFRQNVTKF